MKTVLALLGFFLGALAGLALLALNPFGGGSTVSVSGERYSFVTSDIFGMPLGVTRMLNLDWLEPNKNSLQAPGVKNSAVAATVLRDVAGAPAAFAIRLSVIDPDPNLYLGKTGHYSYWTVFWPNQGGALLTGYDSYWPQVSDALLSGVAGGGFVADDKSYPLTEDMAEPNKLMGLSGLFVGATGSYSEVRSNSGSDDTILQGEITIRMD